MSDGKLQEVLQGIGGENSEKLVSALEEQAEIEGLKSPEFGVLIDSVAESVKNLEDLSAEDCCEKGNALFEEGRYEEALKMFDKAIELEPNNATYYAGKGDILFKIGREEEVFELFDKAINQDPNNYIFNAILMSSFLGIITKPRA